MKLAVKTTQTQPKTNNQPFVDSAIEHIEACSRITDIDDLRYFKMRDLQEIRINLHLALELLAVSSRQERGQSS